MLWWLLVFGSLEALAIGHLLVALKVRSLKYGFYSATMAAALPIMAIGYHGSPFERSISVPWTAAIVAGDLLAWGCVVALLLVRCRTKVNSDQEHI